MFAQRFEAKEKAAKKHNIIVKGLQAPSTTDDGSGIVQDLLSSKFNLENAYSDFKVLGKSRNIYKIMLRSTEMKKFIPYRKTNRSTGRTSD